AIMALLFGVPWWTLVGAPAWPAAVLVAGTVVFAVAFVALPTTMMLGHGRRRGDAEAALGDALLGAMWVLFVWSLLGQVLGLGLLL
ncbi:metallophosphoesterase, partial [Mycobacterium sp. ITM-2017-0098]